QWMLSQRNGRGAVETLDKQISGFAPSIDQSVMDDLGQAPFNGVEALAEHKARKELKRLREQALVQMFSGTEVVIKKSDMGLAIGWIKRELSTARKEAGKVAQEAEKAAEKAAVAAARPYIAQAEDTALQLITDVLGDYPIEVVKEVIGELTRLIPDLL